VDGHPARFRTSAPRPSGMAGRICLFSRRYGDADGAVLRRATRVPVVHKFTRIEAETVTAVRVADFRNGSGPFITSEAQIKNNRPGFPGRLGGFGKSVLVSAGTMPLPWRVAATPPSQKVGATPSSRDQSNPPLGWTAGAGDGASPAPAATGASQLHRRPTIAWMVSAGRTGLTQKRFSPPAW
jgi:hypothetical protein